MPQQQLERAPSDRELEPAAQSDMVAAVDLGSNSFHMTVARRVGDQPVVLDRMKEMIRLAAGLDEKNRLTREAMDRAIACLERFGQRLREIPPEAVRAVGTNTLRRARNGARFLRDAEEALGHNIEVISGREEARVVYLGVSHNIEQEQGQRLVVDIGGGSTEFIIGRHFTPILAESLYMGCVGMSQRFFADGKITRSAFAAAELAAKQELEPIVVTYRKRGWDNAVGSSGTILTVREVIQNSGWSKNGISPASLAKLKKALLDSGRTDKLALPGLQSERAPVFPGGVAILCAIFEALKIERMHCSDWALREGLLFDIIGRITHDDIRDRTIADLSERYQVDAAQARRVAETSEGLRDQVKKSWRINKENFKNLLSWSAQLHEVGLSIAHSAYHKHGAYLIQHADLPGFSRQEQNQLALIVRAHRRKFPTGMFESLGKKMSERTIRTAVLLRLAVMLHRGRSDQPLPVINAYASSDVLVLEFPNGWLEEHPLTAADLVQEASYLRAAGIKLEYE